MINNNILEIDEILDAQRFSVGKRVRIALGDSCYPTYSDWSGIQEYKDRFVKGALPQRGEGYRIIKIALHDWFHERIYVIEDIKTKQVFMMSRLGIHMTSEDAFWYNIKNKKRR